MWKGTGFLQVTTALKAHPRGPGETPAALRHYLTDDLLMTEWYPEQDFLALMAALARCLEADGMTDVWAYFGRVTAERDLKGTQDHIPVARRSKKAGIYRGFAAEQPLDAGTALTRMIKLWTLYHDTGRLVVGRSASNDYNAVFRVYEYDFMIPNFTKMLTAYWSEYLKIVGLRATLRLGRTTTGPSSFTEWEVTFEQSPELVHSLASFPILI
jgi:hypothetical protein